MTFYSHMMKYYLHKSGPANDLAKDMKFDELDFPRNDSRNLKDDHEMIYIYLLRQGACSDCLQVFERCWRVYAKCEKNRLNQKNQIF